MALVILRDNTQKEIKDSEKATRMWALYSGLEAPETPEQEQYVSKLQNTIQAIYLSPYSAPDAYIEQHLMRVLPTFIASEWRLDMYGNPTKPATEIGWDRARRFGFWSHGRRAKIVDEAWSRERKIKR